MIRLFVRHPVNDFDSWKSTYDAFDAERSGLGVRAHAVYQSATDPLDVTVWHDFDNLEAAQGFVATPQLREAMKNAGVNAEPTIWFTQPV